MKTALIIRHVPFEGIAGFRQPIEADGYEIERIDVTEPAFQTIDLVAPDLVCMMGGPMGVYETEAFPWIGCQIARLRARLAADRPTLGVCLGSQMIAAALGARVYPGPVKEVGFAPITLELAGKASALRHLRGHPMLHWHGDTFDIPEGTELLASTEYYPQAFRRGANLLAIQCHPEMGEDPRIAEWIAAAGADSYIAEAGTDAATLRADYARLGPPAVAAGRAAIAEWLTGLAAA